MNTLPHRIHEVMDAHVVASPDRTALIDDNATLTYRELDRAVERHVDALRALGVRAGDRVMLVSENSIPLACLLFAASRLDAWAIVANPRLSPRELDQIRDHSGARRMFFTAGVSEEAVAHAVRYDAPVQDVGALRGIGVSALNEVTQPEPVEADGAHQVAVLIYTSGTTGTPKGRHAHTPEPAVLGQEYREPTQHDGGGRTVLRTADLAYRRHFAADDDADGRRGDPAGQQV